MIVYVSSPYTSAIIELERTADFVADMGRDAVSKYCKDFCDVISAAIRRRADRLREQEASEAGGQ